jgi:hypothetical protein
MRQKLILFAVLAVVGIVVLAAASVTVYALSVGPSEALTPSEQVKVIPIKAEPVVEPQAAPVRYEHSSGHFCNESVKMQMTQKPVEETSSEQLLTQAR